MQKLQLSIPEPCHENWQQMTPTDQGRFCNACAKEVVDFSMMTDTEVLNYFTTLTHDKVCGRTLPSQLERTIIKPKDPRKRLFWYWNYIVMFFIFFTKGNAVKAQGNVKSTTEQNPSNDLKLRGQMITKGEVKNEDSRVITGKALDKDGNPVSYASIKIKGTNTGVSADANGAYSIKADSKTILIISAAGFKESEIPVKNQLAINTVMEKGGVNIKEMVITCTMGGVRSVSDAIFVVKDIQTGLPINKAKLIIETDNSDPIIAFTDDKGNYKAKKIHVIPNYHVKIMAEGYQNNEFTINEIDFKNGKKEWQVLLKKQKPAFGTRVERTAQNIKGEMQVNIVGQTRIAIISTDSLYIIDGLISTKQIAASLSPDDISEIKQLKQSEAAALYGIQGANGAVVITTRKAKELKLNEVVVTSGTSCTSRMAGGISFTNTYEATFLGDTIATVKTLLTDSIKVYPNPVEPNTGFSVALKLKQAGNYSIQVTDATGKILLLQKFNATAKDHTEKIMSDSRWAAGIYYIRVFDAQNKLINKSSFIFR